MTGKVEEELGVLNFALGHKEVIKELWGCVKKTRVLVRGGFHWPNLEQFKHLNKTH